MQVLEGQKETLSDQVTSLSDQITAADAVAAMHEQELIELKKTVSAAGTSDKHARTEMEQLQAQVASYKAQQVRRGTCCGPMPCTLSSAKLYVTGSHKLTIILICPLTDCTPHPLCCVSRPLLADLIRKR